VQVYDFAGRPVEPEIFRVDWGPEAAEKGGWEHFMLKEIMEQPRALRSALAPRLRDGLVDFGAELGSALPERLGSVVITACGSAYYAGCVGKLAIERLCRVPVTAELASEL